MVVTSATWGRVNLYERRDLARVVHADLEDAEVGAPRHAGERERHAPMVVVGGGGGMRAPAGREHDAQHLLGARLADRARHRDDARLRPRARGDAEPLQRFERVIHSEHRAEGRERVGPLATDDGRRARPASKARDA